VERDTTELLKVEPIVDVDVERDTTELLNDDI